MYPNRSWCLVHLRDRFLEIVGGQGREVVRGDDLVLRVTDRGRHRPRREPLRIEVQVLDDARDEPLGVALVVDREPAGNAEVLVLATQDPCARRMEGEDPHAPSDPGPHQSLDSVGHLSGRLVRERDRQDRAGRSAPLTDQVGDPMCEGARLARPRTRHDEHGPLGVQDGLGLDVVEALDQG